MMFLIICCLIWIPLILAALIVLCQDKLIFHPATPHGYRYPEANPEGLRNPGEADIPFENVEISTKDGELLRGWLMVPISGEEAKKRPTLIFFQGNAGNMGFRLPNLSLLYHLCELNVLAVPYRGYSHSSGKPTELGLYEDARVCLEYLRTLREDKIDATKIFIMGRSLGGAIAVNLASREEPKIAGMILENTFTSIYEMAVELFPFLRFTPFVIRALQRFWFSSDKLIRGSADQKLELPCLFISGTEDALVPPRMMMQLFDQCTSGAKSLVLVHGGGHNDSWEVGGRAYYKVIKTFIADAVGRGRECKAPQVINIGRPRQVLNNERRCVQ